MIPVNAGAEKPRKAIASRGIFRDASHRRFLLARRAQRSYAREFAVVDQVKRTKLRNLKPQMHTDKHA
jgi:hypothetical protein